MPSQFHIISALAGYGIRQVLPFISSLEAVEFHGTLHAMVWEQDDELISFLNDKPLNIKVHVIGARPSTYRNRVARVVSLLPIFVSAESRPSLLRYSATKRLLRSALPVSSLRYIEALQIVEDLPRDSVVLLTDSRDVIFQSCPFTHYLEHWPDELHLSMEPNLIQPLDWTYKWCVGVYGENVVEETLRGKLASCSGTTIGSKELVELYLARMVKEILKYRWRISHTTGFDQGLHNFLLYTGQFDHGPLSANGEGVFWIADRKPVFDSSGFAVVRDRVRATVVHQYDRSLDRYRESEYFLRLLPP